MIMRRVIPALGVLMVILSDIYDLVSEISGVRPDRLKPGTDLFADLGMEGDDFFELETKFADRFSVDMSQYCWYFHHGEEGVSIGGLIFPPPYRRVKRIPITPELLLASANAHRWLLAYPEHKLPSRRFDLLFNQLILGATIVAGVIYLVMRFLNL
jgi:hypothetical protein